MTTTALWLYGRDLAGDSSLTTVRFPLVLSDRRQLCDSPAEMNTRTYTYTHTRIHTYTHTHTSVCEWITRVFCSCVRHFGHTCHLHCIEEKVLPDASYAHHLFSGDALLFVLPHRVCQHHAYVRYQSVDKYDGRPQCVLVFARHLQRLWCLHSL